WKKVFPWIMVLMTLSLLGIMLIQMSWIRSSIELKRERYNQDLRLSLEDISKTLIQEYVSLSGHNPHSFNNATVDAVTRNFLLQSFTIRDYQPEYVHEIIAHSLNNHNIDQPFKFSVDHAFSRTIMHSSGWNNTLLNTSVVAVINPESNKFVERLYIHIEQKKTYYINQMMW